MANIDTLVIVCSTVSPAPNYTVIDKMTATAVYNNIEPVIVISKSDIKSGEEIYNIYNSTGIKTILYSSVTGEGVDEKYIHFYLTKSLPLLATVVLVSQLYLISFFLIFS